MGRFFIKKLIKYSQLRTRRQCRTHHHNIEQSVLWNCEEREVAFVQSMKNNSEEFSAFNVVTHTVLVLKKEMHRKSYRFLI